MSVSVSLARRASSESHHLRAACGDAPASMVCSTRPSAPAPTVSRISRSEKPQASWSRARRSCGGSGSEARSRSTHSLSGAIGTRSGSGK